MNDEQYNNFIKKQLEENEDSFFSEIEHDKKRTWNFIEYRLEKKRITPLWLYYAAAFLLLLLGVGFLFKQEIMLKNTEIAQLGEKLMELERNKLNEKIKIVKQTDTLNLVRDKIIYVQIVKHDTIVKYDTITQLLKQTDTVYIKEEPTKLIAENELSNTNIIAENEPTGEINNIKKKKKRRFVFRFGTPRNIIENNVKAEPLITLRTEF